MNKEYVPGIAEFYSGQHILITGATGFIGKVLVEKLLRSCPDLEQLYIIIRSRKGKSPSERWDELTKLELFDLLKKRRPLALSTKITVLDGDVSKDQLGLTREDYKLLVDKISIIFHVAASVRFNDPLHEAVKLNVSATKQIVDLALQSKNIKVLQHVSTAYANVEFGKVIEEKIYPAKYDWREVIKIAEKTDPIELAILTNKYLGKTANTYILAKALAEQIVWEARNKIPLVLFRPSIVISSWMEPVKGWIDNFNGPVALVIGIGKGVIRTLLGDADLLADYVMVDIVVKAMIVSAWKRATINTDFEENDFVINCASTYKNFTNGDINKMGFQANEILPLEEMLWYPDMVTRSNETIFRIEAFYKHFLPALFVDTLLKIFGKKPLLLKIQIKIQTAMLALKYFTLQGWKFNNDHFLSLTNIIPKNDLDEFDFKYYELDPADYFLNSTIIGGKKYLIKEKGGNEENVRKRYYRLKWLHYGFLTIFYSSCIWAIYWLTNYLDPID